MNNLLNPGLTRGGMWLLEPVNILPALYSCTKPFSLTAPGGYGEWVSDDTLFNKAYKIANKLAWKDNGEAKFLRMIPVHMEIRAPRYWWSHFDTYKVGTVAQSESTMHTLKKRPMTEEDCEYQTSPATINEFNMLRLYGADIDTLKANLPEGFLQSRVVEFNYANLQSMWYQRHRQEVLGWWKIFLEGILQLPEQQWLVGNGG